jgi:hypothetical protein
MTTEKQDYPSCAPVDRRVRPLPCCCGEEPGIFFISGSALRLRVIGCKHCKITSPARMTNDDAATEWNNFKRNDKDGSGLSVGLESNTDE